MNLNKLLFTLISEKVKYYREKILKKNQSDFIAYLQTEGTHIDRSQLSRIENGHADPHKNPNLMSSSQIEDFSKIMDISIKNFIFGDEDKREEIVKIILLSILMNGSKKNENEMNPFFNLNGKRLEFITGALYNLNNEELKIIKLDREVLYRYINDYESSNNEDYEKHTLLISLSMININSFFFNHKNFFLYKDLDNKYDQKLELNSNLLLKLLFSDFEYAADFINRQSNIGLEPFTKSFLYNEGVLGKTIIDEKQLSYRLFINAFESMFDRNRKQFMNYFDINLFDNVENTSSNYMSFIKSKRVYNIITSSNLTKLLINIYQADQLNKDTFLGHHHIKNSYMMESSKVSPILREESMYNYDDYLEDARNLSEYYIFQEGRVNNNFKLNIDNHRNTKH